MAIEVYKSPYQNCPDEVESEPMFVDIPAPTIRISARVRSVTCLTAYEGGQQMSKVKTLAVDCANSAWKNGGSERNSEGNLLMPLSPMADDFKVWKQFFTEQPDLKVEFEREYTKQAIGLCQGMDLVLMWQYKPCQNFKST